MRRIVQSFQTFLEEKKRPHPRGIFAPIFDARRHRFDDSEGGVCAFCFPSPRRPPMATEHRIALDLGPASVSLKASWYTWLHLGICAFIPFIYFRLYKCKICGVLETTKTVLSLFFKIFRVFFNCIFPLPGGSQIIPLAPSPDGDPQQEPGAGLPYIPASCQHRARLPVRGCGGSSRRDPRGNGGVPWEDGVRCREQVASRYRGVKRRGGGPLGHQGVCLCVAFSFSFSQDSSMPGPFSQHFFTGFVSTISLASSAVIPFGFTSRNPFFCFYKTTHKNHRSIDWRLPRLPPPSGPLPVPHRSPGPSRPAAGGASWGPAGPMEPPKGASVGAL